MSPHPCSMDKSCDGTGEAQTPSLLPNCIQNASEDLQCVTRAGPGEGLAIPCPPGSHSPSQGSSSTKPLGSTSPEDYQSKSQTVARLSLRVLPGLVNVSKANSRSLPAACSSTLGRSKIWEEPATACFQPFFHAMAQAGYLWYIWYIYFLPLY